MSNFLDQLRLHMETTFRTTPIENGVRLNTHCLYPNNSFVQVVVMGSGGSFFVSDSGGAFKEAESAGASIPHPDKQFGKLLKKQGLSIRNGAIYSPSVSLDAVPAAIAIVANTSKEMADAIFENWRLAKTRNFKDAVRKILRETFLGEEVKETKLTGTSNKPHTFENVVHFLDGKMLVVDPVLKDPNSINSRLVANLDLHAQSFPHIKQRIVYDDAESWQAADLSLLSVSGVTVVPFSKSEQALRLATQT